MAVEFNNASSLIFGGRNSRIGSGLDENVPARNRSSQSAEEIVRRQALPVPAIDYAAIQRKVEAKADSEQANFRKQRSQEDYPLTTQRALEVYASTSRTNEQDTNGGQLLGVDIYV